MLYVLIYLLQVFAFALQLSPRDYKQVNWERSKRFANGAVIGLSRDDFETVIFAVVIQRDLEMLKKGDNHESVS